ncbi:hypothetical protein [Flavobacterium sp.]|uniref:hypothetical protein n=1 Tax=Flavobacterium sp. TaxID=239 RepID=UPI003D131E3C
MKKILLLLFVLISSYGYSQYGYGGSNNNTTNIYIVETPKPNPYGTAVDYTRDAYESGRTQSELQKKYNYNYERFSNAFNDISNKIYALNINREAKDRIIRRWNIYVDKIKSTKINFVSNSEVTDYINHSYNQINKVIYEETSN